MQPEQLLHLAANTTTEMGDRHESLAAAFEFFNDTSQQLMRSYRLLENKVQQLTAELDTLSAEKADADNRQAETANQMAVLLKVMPAGVIVLDSRGYIIEANAAAQTLLQLPLKGRLWREIISDCFAPRNDDGLEVSTKSGRRVNLATSSLDTGEPSCVGGQIILLTDLTETRKLQQHVSRSERLSAMGKMVSALAHQIRTPLSAAMLYADHLCGNSLPEPKRHDFSRKLHSRLQHMERQVRDMLLFVKSELPLNDLLTCEQLVQGLQEAAEVALSSSKCQCRWQNLSSGGLLKCHREALISALMNLLENSIQASDGPASIEIILAGGQEAFTITLRDKGPGIPPQLLASACEIFMTTKSQGTGLGLAVVQSVVRAHGGSLELHSPEGEGLTVEIQLPVHQLAAVSSV
ncbi:PAS/PAC sensor signal transduction histidine kinase [Alteromonadaceae bacterium Bs31]|nr:PAS/PAC sensor signal transduction histidine kinase [Alteromonadaceae bacterium Bs31]